VDYEFREGLTKIREGLTKSILRIEGEILWYGGRIFTWNEKNRQKKRAFKPFWIAGFCALKAYLMAPRCWVFER